MVAVLEAEAAELLGKPAAVLVLSGTMAEQSVLRVAWTVSFGAARTA